MKAINYLEFQKVMIDNDDEYIVPYINVMVGFHSTLSFYSQPFSPEMLTKYFKGWELKKGYEKAFTNKKNIIDFTDYTLKRDGESFTAQFIRFTNAPNFIPMPLTLNHFIETCQSYKIDLEFKDE